MPRLSSLSENGTTALMVRLGMGSAKQYLHRWWQSSDGTDLSLAYDRAIAGGQRTIRIAEGNWTWSTPKNYVAGLRLIGEGNIVRSGGVGGTKITAPNGFLKNNDTTRKQIVIQNLHIIGDGDSVGIDGPFGGTIEGCKLEGFNTLIQNMSGYLTFYREISFANAAFGLKTADANGSVVEQCHFNADVAVQITTRDGTPQTGVNSGLPFIIRENNFNMSDATTAALRLRGQLKIADNYFEKFSGSTLNTMVDIEANRFDHQGLIMEGNEMNGQGANCRAVYLNGSHLNLDNWTEGRITCNRMLGMATYIEYGPNNRIPGLKIYGNSRTTGDFAIPIVNSYQNQHVPNFDGWTEIVLGSDFSTTLATLDDVPGLAFTPDSNALYRVEFNGMVRTSSAAVGARPGITWPLVVGDGTVFSSGASSAAATTPRYGNTSAATFEMTTSALADATGSWPAEMRAQFYTGTVTGPFKIGLRSGTAGTAVTMKAGSYIRYRRMM